MLEAAQGKTGEHRKFKIMAKGVPAGKHKWTNLEENFQTTEIRLQVEVLEGKLRDDDISDNLFSEETTQLWPDWINNVCINSSVTN